MSAVPVAGQAFADAGVVVAPSVRHHADRAVYRQWVWRHYSGTVRRHSRLGVYDEFVAQWPHLEDWFNAPLAQRLLDCSAEQGRTANAGPQVRMPYLVYLSLVEGVALDYDLLLGRTFASPFTTATYPSGLGVDLRLFDQHVARLTQLGYTARVPRQVVGRFCLVSNVGMVGSAKPRCTSCGRFQAIASCGRTVLYSMR